MASSLLAERHHDPISRNRAANFAGCWPNLKAKFNRRYDYERSLCDDPEIIRGWFRHVENMKAKYGILDEDTSKFGDSGFMMGMISTGVVVTSAERQGWLKGIYQGDREWMIFNPRYQRDRMVDPTLHISGQAPPLFLVQGRGSTSRFGHRSL